MANSATEDVAFFLPNICFISIFGVWYLCIIAAGISMHAFAAGISIICFFGVAYLCIIAAFLAPVRSVAETPSVGVKVMAPWTNGKLYPGKVSRVTGAGVVTILFDDGDTRAGVAWTACTARATGTVSIHEAIRRKDLQAVKKCIESGRDVNVKGPDGNYPLASAAHDGLTEIVDALLVAGSEVNNCVEINQCVGGTRQFFTKSFLGDAAAVLARSSGEEPA